MIAGAATGILRTMLVDKEKIADLIPVDVAINVMIVSAWKRSRMSYDDCFGNEKIQNKQPPIYNCTSGNVNPILWGDIEEWSLNSIWKYPVDRLLWYPGGSLKKWKVHDRICRVLLHYLPAFLVDICLTILRKGRFMTKLTFKMTKSMEALEFFATRQWSWTNDNLMKLQADVEHCDEQSLQIFNFDLKTLDWRVYFDKYVLGTRHFVLKNDPNTLDSSRKKMKLMQMLHFFVQFCFIFIIYYLFKCYI